MGNSSRLFETDTSVFEEHTPSAQDLSAPLDLTHLVHYLTAHTVIDYAAISDFFLTYRLFAPPNNVLQLLFSRLEWAARVSYTKSRADSEVGRDVAVRTFVVIRHWILNYFVDDFLPDLDLRQLMAYALNTLSLLPEVTASPHLAHILKQLKRCWLGELALHWNVTTNTNEAPEDLPVYAGGPYGLDVPSQSPAQRRLTLLSFYKGPIEPIALTVDTKQHGSLLKGGILVDNDVEVSKIKNSTLKPSGPTRRHFFRRRHDAQPPEDIVLENKVDVLALQVVKDLNSMLKWRVSKSIDRERSFISHITQARLSDSTLSRFRASQASSISTIRQPKRDKTSDTLDIATALVNTSSESDEDDRKAEEKPLAQNTSYDDNVVNLRRSAACWNGSGDSSEVGGLEALNIERVSYSGSLSTLSTLSRHSISSYDDEDEAKPFSYEHTFSCANPEAFESAIEVSPFKPAHQRTPVNDKDDDEFHDTESVIQDFLENDPEDDSDISLLSEQSTGGMAPCPGFNAEIAAELAAIPDESTHEDALITALRKLEGTYEPIVKSGQRSDTLTESQLFQSAFASTNNLNPTAADDVAAVQSLAIGRAPSIISNIAPEALDEPDHNTLDRSRHAPFILAMSAEDIYQQMTFIERDALEQVDWKVLIDVSWPKRPSPTYSWLQLLATKPPQGIEVVISRFNLVVNWVRSEIILCLTPSLKAQTIIRFIQIAYLSYKGQNMATLMQIVLGLTNRVIEREVAAWNLISKKERRILDRLKTITSVDKNFSRLRAEHARFDFSKGCIPFTGIYLSDLEHNNQRPTFNDKGEIVFAKFQMAASVVRSYLQCIEWAKNYQLKTTPSVLSKCLYLQSLSQQDFDLLEA